MRRFKPRWRWRWRRTFRTKEAAEGGASNQGLIAEMEDRIKAFEREIVEIMALQREAMDEIKLNQVTGRHLVRGIVGAFCHLVERRESRRQGMVKVEAGAGW